MTTKQKINKVFTALRKAGYFAKQKFWCCQTCALSAIPDGIEKYVYYNKQDADSINEDGSLNKHLCLAWEGDGLEICKIIRAQGLSVKWDGSKDTRIKILPEGQAAESI